VYISQKGELPSKAQQSTGGIQEMRFKILLTQLFLAAIAFTLTLFCGAVLFGQEVRDGKVDHKAYKAEHKERAFCSNNNYSSDNRVSVSDLRELTMSASGNLSVDAGRNGGIHVIGEDRTDILVRACVQAWGASEEAARAIAGGVRISQAPSIKAEGGDESMYSVSYKILVPRATNLDLRAHNGGIAIGSVEGRIEFETTNGGVSLAGVAGDVRGRTTNGGVNVKLVGTAWKGSGLDVVTSNGGVNILMAENYAANIETGTVNGGFKSDIAALNVESSDKSRGVKINTALNGGGAPIRVITTNGGIRISSGDMKY
jgi:hypothetical protein